MTTRTPEQRFSDLFRGFESRHGRYAVKRQESSGKMSGDAKTLDSAPSVEDYGAHLRGEYGIGIIPLTSDNRVYFGAIDIDQYPVSHAKIADAVRELPVLVTRSKSGGAHIWLFVAGGAPAEQVITVLKEWAAELGYGGCEIFPKQSYRAKREDVGNWINLPYFGDTRKCVMVDRNGSPVDLDLEEFLDVAEKCAQSVDEHFLTEVAPRVRGQRDLSDSKEDWEDGPPCLQRIVKDGGPPEGTRNAFFFNAAVYLARKYTSPDTVKDKLTKLNAAFEDSLPTAELERSITSATTKEYGYQCSQAPLCNYCKRQQCLSRKYGVGSGVLDYPVEIGGFSKILTDPVTYIFNADGRRVEIKGGSRMLHQPTFQGAILDATSKVVPLMKPEKWGTLVMEWLKAAIEVEPPPDSDPRTAILEELSIWLDRFRSRNKADVHSGKAYWDEEEGYAVFRINPFMKHLRNQRVNFPQPEVTRYLRDNGVIYSERGTTWAGKSSHIWKAPLSDFVDQGEEDEQ